MKKLIKNYSYMLVVQVITYLVPILTIPFIIRSIGIEKFGLVSFSQSFLMFFYLIVDFGFSISATKEFSVSKSRQEDENILAKVFCAKLILLFLSLSILVILVTSVDMFFENRLLHLTSFLWVVGQGFSPIWYFQGKEDLKIYTLVQAVSKLIYLIFIVILVNGQGDYMMIPLINGLVAILATAFLYGFLFFKFKLSFLVFDISLRAVTQALKVSYSYFLSRVSVVLYSTANVFFLGLYAPSSVVGYYAVSEKLYLAVQSLASPIVQVLYPYMCKTRDVVTFRKIVVIVFVSVLFGIFVLFNYSTLFLSLISNGDVSDISIDVINILLVAIVFSVISMLHGYPLLGALGFPNYANNSVMLASVFHLSGIIMMYYFDMLSPTSLAVLIVLTQGIDCLYRLFFVKKLGLLK